MDLKEALPLVDRMKDAMTGELARRQELLKTAGNFSSLQDYDRARAAGAKLAPTPASDSVKRGVLPSGSQEGYPDK